MLLFLTTFVLMNNGPASARFQVLALVNPTLIILKKCVLLALQLDLMVNLKSLPEKPDSGILKVREEVHVALQPFYLSNIQFGIYSYLNKQLNRWHSK